MDPASGVDCRVSKRCTRRCAGRSAISILLRRVIVAWRIVVDRNALRRRLIITRRIVRRVVVSRRSRHLARHHLRCHPLRRPASRAGAGIALATPNATAGGDAEMTGPIGPLTTGLHGDADRTARAHTAAHGSCAAGGADNLTVDDLQTKAKPGLARALVRADDHTPAAVIARLGNSRTSCRDTGRRAAPCNRWLSCAWTLSLHQRDTKGRTASSY
jgi:hypothetical protein